MGHNLKGMRSLPSQTHRIVKWALLLLGAVLYSSATTAIAQGATASPSITSACVIDPAPHGITCYQSLFQAEAALRQLPNYGPYYYRAESAVTVYNPRQSSVLITYRLKNPPPSHFYAPGFSSIGKCEGSETDPKYMCATEQEAWDAARTYLDHANYNCDRPDIGITGAYHYPFDSIRLENINEDSVGIISFNYPVGTGVGLGYPPGGKYRAVTTKQKCMYPDRQNVTKIVYPETAWLINMLQKFECPIGFHVRIGYSAERVEDIKKSNPNFGPKPLKGTALCESSATAQIRVTTQQIGSCGTAHPCHPATGDKSRAEVDFRFAGLPFVRHYHSLGQVWGRSGIGTGWSIPYDMRMSGSALIDQDGTIETFTAIATTNANSSTQTTTYRGNNSPDRILIQQGTRPETSSYILHEIDGTIAYFAPGGRLTAIEHPEDVANSITLQYSGTANDSVLTSVTDGLGRMLHFEHDDDGHLVQIVQPDGHTVQYSYDSDDNLVAVDYGNAQIKRYTYHEAGLANADQRNLLTGIISEDGQRYASFSYDIQGRPVSSMLLDGTIASDGTANAVERTTLNYSSDTSVQVAEDGYGTRTFTIQPGLYRRILAISDANGSFTYQVDSDGRISAQTDPRGVTTTYGYTASYRAAQNEAVGTAQERDTKITRSEDNLLTREEIWSPGGDKPAGLMQIQTFAYDAAHRMTASCIIDPTIALARSYGCGTSTHPPAGVLQTLQTYCADGDSSCPLPGLRTSSTDGRGNTLYYDYYPADAAASCGSAAQTCAYRKGDLMRIRDGAGHNVFQVLAYDGAGRILSLVDSNGVNNTFLYDSRGRMQQMTTHNAQQADQVTQLTYTAEGELAQWVTPAGDAWQAQYDAALRLLGISNGKNQQLRYVLDKASNSINDTIRGEIFVPTPPAKAGGGTVAPPAKGNGPVIGRVDSLVKDATGRWSVQGWTCYRGYNTSLRVDVYAGPFVVQAHKIATGTASQPSDTGIAHTCQTDGSAYRFSVQLPENVQQDVGGQGVYVFGIAPTGQDSDNVQLDGSGVIVPVAGASSPSTIPAAYGPVIGRVDSLVKDASGRWSVQGWTCYQGYNNPLRVDVYAGPFVVQAHHIASGTANQPTDAGFARACHTGGSAYRFSVQLPENVQQDVGGQGVYVFGIAPTGQGSDNVQLDGSGVIVPVAGASSPSTIPAAYGPVIGRVDNLVKDATGRWSVQGWTCYRGYNNPLRVDVYAGPFVVQAHKIASGTANQPTDAGFARACQTGGSAYRFNVQLPENVQQDVGGQGVYVFGIAPTGQGSDNVQLDGSGVIVPVAGASSASIIPAAYGPVIGHIDNLVKDASGRWSVQGWACYRGYNNPIRVDVYLKRDANEANMSEIATAFANRLSDANMARACQTGGSAYRFDVQLPENVGSNSNVKYLYIYGISPTGTGNVLLDGSARAFR